jgi:cytochrome c2
MSTFNGNKQSLSQKTCLVCGRSFTWRKKWAKNWEHVKYCSKACSMLKSKKGIVSLILFFFIIGSSWVIHTEFPNPEKPIFIPPSIQQEGNAEKGYQYLINGDFIKSGLPYSIYINLFGKDEHNYLARKGKAASIPAGFNLVKHSNGSEIVVPTCLQCHSQMMDDKLMVGLGNTELDFTNLSSGKEWMQAVSKSLMKLISPKQFEASEAISNSLSTIAPLMRTEVRGINAADRLAILLVAHRDPSTLEWKQIPLLNIPNEVVPTDVPAWWLLKKKNAMFYNGFGRGDFGKFLMLSNLLTVKDSSEAREVSSHFNDVLAFLKKLEAPKYPGNIDFQKAIEGEKIFIANCSKCHGTYGEKGVYPNLLIPASIIKTDSLLFKSNYQNPQFIDWFNNSWFSKGENAAKLFPSNGYVAPPLDGVWITAPYFHNGSVPSLEAVINSKIRPAYWAKDFKKPYYDTENLCWKYTVYNTPLNKQVYNTTLAGYNNQGHYFGDALSDQERKSLIEYLKTL